MKRTDSIIKLAAEYYRGDRALRRHLNSENDALWDAAYKRCVKAQSKILRSRPTSYKEAKMIVSFVRRELAWWGQEITNKLVKDLRKAGLALNRGRRGCTTWTQLDCVVQWLTRLIPQVQQFRPLRRALRSVCAFIESQGGRPDPRQIRVWI
jgi:hypothetical protein